MATIKYWENETWQEIAIEGGGSDITLDTEMSDTSENAVSNRVIKEYIDSHVFDMDFSNEFDNNFK